IDPAQHDLRPTSHRLRLDQDRRRRGVADARAPACEISRPGVPGPDGRHRARPDDRAESVPGPQARSVPWAGTGNHLGAARALQGRTGHTGTRSREPTEDEGRAALGGQRQALSLLMAGFTQPRILLLDELAGAVYPQRASLVTALTKKIVENDGLTTLMVTHNMEQAIALGNRLIMMHEGRIIYQATAEQKKDLTVETLLGE